MDATCAESWGRPECRFVLSSLALLPWTAGSVLLTGLATLEITQTARRLQILSVGWVGLLAGLSLIASLVALTLGPTWTSVGWGYGSFAILVAAATRLTPPGETRRLAPDILLVGLPVLLYVGFVGVLLILA
jgi:hypothetical protein